MRTWTSLRTLAAVSALLLPLACGCANQIKWYPDFNQAQPVAQREGRPMLLYFWDWLSPDTARLDMQVFPDPRVVAATRRTVNVRLEQTWFRDLARRYDVHTTPTFILTDPQGAEHTRRAGVPTDQEFVTWLTDALAKSSATQQAIGRQAAATQPTPMTLPPAAPPGAVQEVPPAGPGPQAPAPPDPGHPSMVLPSVPAPSDPATAPAPQ